jgi:hypothetical protein
MIALIMLLLSVVLAVYAWVAAAPTHLWSWLFVILALLALHLFWEWLPARYRPGYNRPTPAPPA